MKFCLIPPVLFIFLLLLFGACRKNSPASSVVLSDTTRTIDVRWMIQRDSLANINNYWFSEGYPIPGEYNGTVNDYIDFSSDGRYTGHENGIDGSGTYKIFSDSTISIPARPALKMARILKWTSGSLIIFGSDTSVTGGILVEKIWLSR